MTDAERIAQLESLLRDARHEGLRLYVGSAYISVDAFNSQAKLRARIADALGEERDPFFDSPHKPGQ